jgi:2-C-methyl-D-erythritol 4-phosphate cytidylyltransferase/2-C-methyl-D-erythritol 2,4-cyclodiphosphate synthase
VQVLQCKKPVHSGYWLLRFRIARKALKQSGIKEQQMARVAAIVVAAGQGVRAGGDLPKQFRRIGGDTLLQHTLSAFVGVPGVSLVQPVIRPEDLALVRALTDGMNILTPVSGGATRQASVRAGLEGLEPRKPDIVLVHDAARPFASANLIARAIAAAEKTGAAIPALPVTDTVQRVDAGGNIETTLDRNSIRLVQTPQAFAFPALLEAHRRAAAQGRDDFTDDAALAEWAG